VLSHANVLTVVDGSVARLELSTAPPVIFLYPPLAHVLARLTVFAVLATGGTLVFWSGDRERLVEELRSIPTSCPPALKIKRNVIVTRYASLVEQLYAKPGP
jgi:long-subunit acyl-CoA synthetase (AMP-forming)